MHKLPDNLLTQVFEAFHGLRKQPMHMMATFGLPLGEFMALHKIGDHPPPAACTVSELCNEHISMSAVSQAIASMERKGWVTRSMSKKDRRKITVALTPEGQAFVDAMHERMDEIMRRTIAQYGEPELRTLIGMMRRLAEVNELVNRELAEEMKRTQAEAGELKTEGESKP